MNDPPHRQNSALCLAISTKRNSTARVASYCSSIQEARFLPNGCCWLDLVRKWKLLSKQNVVPLAWPRKNYWLPASKEQQSKSTKKTTCAPSSKAWDWPPTSS